MPINPDQGVRAHSRFVRVENGAPVALDNTPLRWRTDGGQRPTDEWLRAQEPAYYGWIEVALPTFDPDTEKVVEVPLTSLNPNTIDGTVTQVWQIIPLTVEEIANRAEMKRLAKIHAVNVERDLRIQDGFYWNGVKFDARPEDKTRIAGAAQLAFMYLVNGGDPLAVDWNDPGSNIAFGWISSDNTIVTMKAPEVIDFAKAAARWESLNVFAARNLKDMPDGVPDDYATNYTYWPDPETFMT